MYLHFQGNKRLVDGVDSFVVLHIDIDIIILYPQFSGHGNSKRGWNELDTPPLMTIKGTCQLSLKSIAGARFFGWPTVLYYTGVNYTNSFQ